MTAEPLTRETNHNYSSFGRSYEIVEIFDLDTIVTFDVLFIYATNVDTNMAVMVKVN